MRRDNQASLPLLLPILTFTPAFGQLLLRNVADERIPQWMAIISSSSIHLRALTNSNERPAVRQLLGVDFRRKPDTDTRQKASEQKEKLFFSLSPSLVTDDACRSLTKHQ